MNEGYIVSQRTVNGNEVHELLVGEWPQTTSITRDVFGGGAVERNGDLLTVTFDNGSADYRITSEDDGLDLVHCELVVVRP